MVGEGEQSVSNMTVDIFRILTKINIRINEKVQFLSLPKGNKSIYPTVVWISL